jgi:hypothetical protein
MKGTLYIVGEKCMVSYWKSDPYYHGSPGIIRETPSYSPVSPESISNPHLSTYWVEGREVEFEIILGSDGWFDDVFTKIIHDDYLGEKGWDRIERELSEQDINGVYETMKWLKENYNPPIKR